MNGYGQLCPVALAAEVLTTRWTPLIVREVLGGSRRFNDLHRGVPRISRTLLSRRLADLEHAGVVERRVVDGHPEYHPTRSCEELRPVIDALDAWGQRWGRTATHDEPHRRPRRATVRSR